jgi:hypothetical protein
MSRIAAISVAALLLCLPAGIFSSDTTSSGTPVDDGILGCTPGYDPEILSLVDVPADQGGYLSLTFKGVVYDAPGSPKPICEYRIYRWTDAETDYSTVPDDSGIDLPDAAAGGGAADMLGCVKNWYQVAIIPGEYQDTYTVTVETLQDLTPCRGIAGWSKFMVRAIQCEFKSYWDSQPDSAQSIDNLPPAPPRNFWGREYRPDVLKLIWDPNTEPDLWHYRIYRGTTPDFVPDPAHPWAWATVPWTYDDEWYPGAELYYKIAAVDIHCNISDYTLLIPGDVVATELQESSVSLRDGAIEVLWRLSAIDDGAAFSVLRTVDGAPLTPMDPAGLAGEGLSWRYLDGDCRPGTVYRYRVDVCSGGTTRTLFETEPVGIPAAALTLAQNRPNPFNPSTLIEYTLPAASPVVLEIYDGAGRRIARIEDGMRPAGAHTVQWDGTNDTGTPVCSGVYFYRLSTGKQTLTRKMILLR